MRQLATSIPAYDFLSNVFGRKNLGAKFFPSPIDASRRELFENDVLRCGAVVFSVEKLSAKNGENRATSWAKRGRKRGESGFELGSRPGGPKYFSLWSHA